MSELVQEVGARLILKGHKEFLAATAEVKKELASVGKTTEQTNAKIIASEKAVAAARSESMMQMREAAALREKSAAAMTRSVELQAAGELEAAKAAKLEAAELNRAAMAAEAHARASRSSARASAEQATAIRASARATEASAAGASRLTRAFTGMAVVGKRTALVAAAVGVVSLKMAGDYQLHTNVLMTAAGETAKGLAVVRQGILNIGVDTGTPFQSLIDGAYLAEKAAYRGADALMVLRAAAQAGREEGVNPGVMVGAMTSLMASYHMGAGQSVQAANALKTGAGVSKVTMEQYAASLSTVLPIASASGIRFSDVAGALGTLTQHGTSAEQGTQDLAGTIRSLVKMNRPQQSYLNQLGLDPTDISKNIGQRGLTGTLNMIQAAVLSHMGKDGLVLTSQFNQSKSARADANLMVGSMPKDLQSIARDFQTGALTLKEFHTTLKGLPTNQANLLAQFAVVQNKASGFSDLVKRGDPLAQAYTGALGRAVGGALPLNTALQLTGPENAAGTAMRVAAVQSSITNKAPDVEGWASTQRLFNVAVERGVNAVKKLAVSLGTDLIPAAMQTGHEIMNVVRWFEKHQTTARVLAFVVGTVLVAAIAAYTVEMVQAAIATVAATWPILAIIAVIALLAAGFVLLWRNSETFRRIVISVFQTVGTVVLTEVKAMLEVVRMFAWVSDKLFGTHFVSTIDGAIRGIDRLQNKLDHINDPPPITITVGVALNPATHLPGFIGPTVAESLARQGIAGPYTPAQRGIAGKRAYGGAVQALRSYVVGEEGPEIFTPSGNGRIRSHAQSRSLASLGTFDTAFGTASDHTAASGGAGGWPQVLIQAGAIVIHESHDPEKTYQAVQKGVSDAMARM